MVGGEGEGEGEEKEERKGDGEGKEERERKTREFLKRKFQYMISQISKNGTSSLFKPFFFFVSLFLSFIDLPESCLKE